MNEKPKRKGNPLQKRWQQLAIGLGLVSLFILGAAAFLVYRAADAFGDTTHESSGEQAKKDIETHLQNPLPVTASDFYYEINQWMDWSAYMRFTIPAQDGEIWLDQHPFCFDEPITGATSDSVGMSQDLSWFNVPTDIDLSASCGNDPFYTIFIDQQDAIWVVYVWGFTT